MSKHETFILTPITTLLEEMKSATACIGSGIETYPFWDYIIQATFTKMTGFQEQKMKCIDWELATNGFDYRISFLEDVKNRGTYSTYAAKNVVYNTLINEIARYSGIDKTTLITDLKNKHHVNPRQIVQQILDDSSIVFYNQREFNEFRNCDNTFKNQYYIVPNNVNDSKSVKLFESVLQGHYADGLYRQRNRIAHNTLSYQQNLPELKALQNEKYLARNYYFWFSILVLIDEIFMELYKIYADHLKGNSYFPD